MLKRQSSRGLAGFFGGGVEQQRADADFEAAADKSLRFFQAAGKCVHNAALAEAGGAHRAYNSSGGFEIVDNHRAAVLLGQPQLLFKQADLPRARCV